MIKATERFCFLWAIGIVAFIVVPLLVAEIPFVRSCGGSNWSMLDYWVLGLNAIFTVGMLITFVGGMIWMIIYLFWADRAEKGANEGGR